MRFDADLRAESNRIGTKPCRARSNLKEVHWSLRLSPSNYFPPPVLVDAFSSTTKKPRASLFCEVWANTARSSLAYSQLHATDRWGTTFDSKTEFFPLFLLTWLFYKIDSEEKYVNKRSKLDHGKVSCAIFFLSISEPEISYFSQRIRHVVKHVDLRIESCL